MPRGDRRAALLRVKVLAYLLYEQGEIRRPLRLLRGLMAENAVADGDDRAGQIIGSSRLQASPPHIPPRRGPAYRPFGARVLYVSAAAVPFHANGYAIRTHALLRALAEAGEDVVCLTRPGYPGDRADRLVDVAGPETEGDGARYLHAEHPSRARARPDAYLSAAAEAVAAVATRERAALIHAASNYETAMPALIAARMLGIPFVYEMRGLWELSAAARLPGWQDSERFRLMRRLETAVAAGADSVLTISAALAREVAGWGVPARRIAVAANGVDPERFAPRAADPALAAELGFGPGAFVVAYAGGLLDYEGLADLLAALPALVAAGVDARLLLVGEGPARPALAATAQTLGIAARVVFTGRVPPEESPRYLALAAAAALPRRPVDVCRLVTPLKPAEAMAMAKPLVASDLPALRELVADGESGLLVPPADPAALAAALLRLARDPQLRARLGATARNAVLQERAWPLIAGPIVALHQRLIAEHGALAETAA